MCHHFLSRKVGDGGRHRTGEFVIDADDAYGTSGTGWDQNRSLTFSCLLRLDGWQIPWPPWRSVWSYTTAFDDDISIDIFDGSIDRPCCKNVGHTLCIMVL